MTLDLNVQPNRDTPLWSETRWNGCWNAEAGVGLYLHAGRLRSDLDVWWAQTVAYLPDNRLVVDRSWGRNPNTAGVTVGALDLTCTETGWTSTFAGAGQLTNYDEMTRAVRGAGYPGVSMSWDVEATAVSPIFDPHQGADAGVRDVAGDAHVQQGYSTTGSLTVDGTTYSLDGVGFKDHSSGTRDWSRWTAHRFTMMVFPDFTVHAGRIFAGDRDAVFGTYFGGDGARTVTALELPQFADRWALPDPAHVVVELDGGKQLPIRSAELIHMLPMTVSEAGDNVNGIDWESPDDPVILMEGIGRVTLEDGTVGHAFFESSARRSATNPPPGR